MLYLILGGTGALIGWLTNVVAIWLLFRPRQPVRIGPWSFHGLLPQRQQAIAKSVGEAIEKELFSSEELLSRIEDPELKAALMAALAQAASAELERRLPAFLPGSLREWLEQQVAEIVARRGPIALETILAGVAENLSELKLGAIVEERLAAFSLDRLEALSYEVAGKELRFIEYAGGVLGLFIGLVQAAIVQSGLLS
ncbi:MAG: DUF445 family protein [Firmicutes bacterium]|jgi:uncharacterized membrane protein YheB (UPF0754 family)|nr:DUF445 family protein [Bacillota bacterium]